VPNIVLIGAGSASFSLALIRDIVLTAGLAGSKMTLVDINEERLNVALTLAQRYSGEVGAALKFSATTDRKKGLAGADFVICAVKIGGYDPLEAERKIAEEHGYYRGIGDRVSCYYGGIGAYHQLKFLIDLAQDMGAICPDAYLIQTANPVFEGTNIITRCTRIKVIGVCHGHFAYRDIARALGLELEHVTAQMAGFNHHIWLTHFLYKGKDAYPLIDEWIEKESEAFWADGEYVEQMTPGAVGAYKLYGLFPIGDAVRSGTPWWYHGDFEAKKKWFGNKGGFDSEIGWADYLANKPKTYSRMECLARDPNVKLAEELPLNRSGEQHIQIIDAVTNDRETMLQLNIPNNGSIKGLPDDVLVEIPAVASGRGVHGLIVGEMPPLVMHNVLIPRWVRMENILNAYLTGDRRPLLLSLMDDPRTTSYDQARGLIDTLFDQPWNTEAAEHYSWRGRSAWRREICQTC
jgi:alpha-galactosidase